jgi:hypothetical protein
MNEEHDSERGWGFLNMNEIDGIDFNENTQLYSELSI